MIKIKELAERYCIHRDTMRKIIKELAKKNIINQKNYHVYLTARSYSQIIKTIGIGKFENKSSIAAKYGISEKKLIDELKLIRYELKELEITKRLLTPRQQQEIYELLGNPEKESSTINNNKEISND